MMSDIFADTEENRQRLKEYCAKGRINKVTTTTADLIKPEEYVTHCIRVDGGIWKFDKYGIRFEWDDGKEITVVELEDDSDE